MRREQPRDLSASVRARLLQIAKERHEEFQLVLTRYAADRFLYRLSRSVHRRTYLLKGATLFAYWTGEFHRVTRDLDLLGAGDPQISSIVATLAEVCKEPVENDGLEFLAETVTCPRHAYWPILARQSLRRSAKRSYIWAWETAG